MFKNNLKIKFGLGAILRNPLRIIAAFFTTVIAIGIAGLCIFTYTYDILVWERDVFFNYANDPYINIVAYSASVVSAIGSTASEDLTYEKYQDIVKGVKEIGGEYATMLWSESGSSTLPEASISVYNLNDYLGVPEEHIEVDEESEYEITYREYNGEALFAPYTSYRLNSWVYNDIFAAMTVYSSEKAIDEFGYTLVGKLPEEINEVAISQWLYNSFLCYGYRNPDTGEVTKISSENDIIGKNLVLTGDRQDHEYMMLNATIVGVIHNDLNDGFINDSLKDGEWNQPSHDYSLPPYLGVAVSEQFLSAARRDDDFEGYVANVTVSRLSEHAEEYFELVTEWKKGKNYFNIVGIQGMQTDEVLGTANITYCMSKRLNNLYTSTPQVFEQTVIYFKLVPFIIPLALVLLAYFSVSTVYGKRREIGILRSMGTKNRKIFLLFLIPISIMAIVTSLAALGVENIFLIYMNNYLFEVADSMIGASFYPFTITPLTLTFTFLAPVVTMTLSLAIAIFILSRRPIRALVAK